MTFSSTVSNEAVTGIVTHEILGMNTDGISSVVKILSVLAAVFFFVVVLCVAITLGCIKRLKCSETKPHASSTVDVYEQSKGEHDYDNTELSSLRSGHNMHNIIYANHLTSDTAPSVPPEKYPINALDSNIETNDTYMSLDEPSNELQTLTQNHCLPHKQDANTSSLTTNQRYETTNMDDSTGLDNEPVYAPLYDVLSSNEFNVPLFKPKNIKLLRTLGMGYFGKVLLAETININWEDFNFTATENYMSSTTKVAVKKLKANCSASIKVAFHKELKFMSRLQHENVVRVLGACLQEEAFIVMEYVKNGALNGFLQNYEDISLADDPTTDLIINIHILIKMSSQIANGMKYLSSKNYIHRDLAARNILVGEEFKVKISDFGMSRNLYTSHYYIMQGRTAVPIRWMARECFSGKFSTETDVWAFGVTMWEIFTLAKCIPYEEMSNEEVAEDALKKHRTLMEIPKKCPFEVYDVMLTCWRDNAQERASFDALYDMLSSLACSLSK